MSTSTDAKKRHVCVHCDQVCSTSSHLARHARIHSGVKEFKCDYPGCEKRSSRLDNLRAHQRIHSGEPRPKKSTKSKGSCAHASPVSSSSSFSSPDISYRPSPPELFHTPAAYSANETMSNSLQLFMPPPPPPQGGFTEDQFCNLSLQPSLAHSRGEHPYPRLSRSMPPPIVRDESANGFNPTMYAQRRASSGLYYPHPSSPYAAPTPCSPYPSSSYAAPMARSPYPYATYPPDTRSPQYSSPQEQWYNWSFSQNNM